MSCIYWLGAKCKGKTLLVILCTDMYCTVTVHIGAQYPKQNIRVFSAALLNGRKIKISLQLQDRDLTWRVASSTHWTLIFFVHFLMNERKWYPLWDFAPLTTLVSQINKAVKILEINKLSSFWKINLSFALTDFKDSANLWKGKIL